MSKKSITFARQMRAEQFIQHMLTFDEHKDDLFLVGAFLTSKAHYPWIKQHQLYNIRKSNLFVTRIGCIDEMQLPKYIVVYNSHRITDYHLFECLGVTEKTQEEMEQLKYPSPSGDYIVYSLGYELKCPPIAILRFLDEQKVSFKGKYTKNIYRPLFISGEMLAEYALEEDKRNEKCLTAPLKIGTIFSGIGAPEQALERLGVPTQIMFACDNGDCEIDVDYTEEMAKVKGLKGAEAKQKYVEDLYRKYSKKINFVKKSYLANYHIERDLFYEDVKLFDGRDFKGQIDLFIGGSPCQSFSIVGARGGLEDTRGTLFYEYCRIVKEIQPKVFVYENVMGVLNHDKGKTWQIMQQVFTELGYSWSYAILDARNFGIPQGRRRLFVVGFKDHSNGRRFYFPPKQKLTYTMQDFLEENTAVGSLQSVEGKLIKVDKKKGNPNDVFYLTPKLLKYCLSPGTKNFMHPDAKIDLPIARALLSTMANHHRSSINNYVTTNGRVRQLTPREAHRLMGFPDSYKIIVSNAQGYKQAGNSIVVDVLIEIFKCIFEAQGWNYGKNNSQE